MLTDPFAGRFDFLQQVRWSSDDAFIGVLRVHYPDPNNEGYRLHGLAIYTADGQLFRSYEDVNDLQWAPTDPPRILHDINPGGDSQVPCILDIITSEDTCFETVERWRHEQSLLTYLFRWSQDGNQLSFITLYDRSLLCTVALITEDITCVAEASDIVVDDIQLRRFLSHGLLSNSRYLFAVLDTEEPGVGWVGSTYLAVASVEGTDFRVLGRMEFSSNPLPRP